MPNTGPLAVDTNSNIKTWGDEHPRMNWVGQSEYLQPGEECPSPTSFFRSRQPAAMRSLRNGGRASMPSGGNSLRELGNSDTATRTEPVEVTGLADSHRSRTHLLLIAGRLRARRGRRHLRIGQQRRGELSRTAPAWSIPTCSSRCPSRTPLQPPRWPREDSESNNGSLLARLTDGTVETCGSDTYRQLGNSGSTNQAVPVKIFSPARMTYRKDRHPRGHRLHRRQQQQRKDLVLGRRGSGWRNGVQDKTQSSLQ